MPVAAVNGIYQSKSHNLNIKIEGPAYLDQCWGNYNFSNLVFFNGFTGDLKKKFSIIFGESWITNLKDREKMIYVSDDKGPISVIKDSDQKF